MRCYRITWRNGKKLDRWRYDDAEAIECARLDPNVVLVEDYQGRKIYEVRGWEKHVSITDVVLIIVLTLISFSSGYALLKVFP